MSYVSSLLLLAGIYLVALVSPGPNFFILTQMSLDGQRRQARWMVFGVTTSSVIWVTLSIAGLATLLASHPWAALAVRFLGAAYLAWYGARLLWSALVPRRVDRGSPRSIAAIGSPFAAYRAGLVTGLTNPKGAAFWTSAFAAFLPVGAPAWFFAATVAVVALMSLSWHLGITLVFGISSLRNAYLGLERAINGIAGGMLITLGVYRLAGR
jgi:threonine efflux protein